MGMDKKRKMVSMLPTTSRKGTAPINFNEDDTKSAKSKGSSYSYALSNKSVLTARI
jgi:hypothetical protein